MTRAFSSSDKIRAEWRCKCGTRVKVVAEEDSSPLAKQNSVDSVVSKMLRTARYTSRRNHFCNGGYVRG
jgi:hypothetical protein